MSAAISAAARVLADRAADACGVDRDDNWKLYSETFIADAIAVIDAFATPAPTDLSKRLRSTAAAFGNNGATTIFTTVALAAADEIERYYAGMLAWKQTAADGRNAALTEASAMCRSQIGGEHLRNICAGAAFAIESLKSSPACNARSPNIADHLFIEARDDGHWHVCVETVFKNEDEARAACRRWKQLYGALPQQDTHSFSCICDECSVSHNESQSNDLRATVNGSPAFSVAYTDDAVYLDKGDGNIHSFSRANGDTLTKPLSVERAAIQPAKAVASFWVVEQFIDGRSTGYWDGGVFEWTLDSMKAIRFSRRADAEQVAEIVEDTSRIAEHVWMGTPAAPVASAPSRSPYVLGVKPQDLDAEIERCKTAYACKPTAENKQAVADAYQRATGTSAPAQPVEVPPNRWKAGDFEPWANVYTYDEVRYILRAAHAPAQPMSLEAERVAFLMKYPSAVWNDEEARYERQSHNYAWLGWQARAALATQQGDKHE